MPCLYNHLSINQSIIHSIVLSINQSINQYIVTHPLKIFRFCPRCGSGRFEVSGSRSLKCRDCGFHLYINSAAAVAALIFNAEGNLLVTRRGVEPDTGKIDLPGGFVDPGETTEEALKRELFEELGVTVKSMRYLTSGSNEYLFSGLTVFTTDIVFRVEADSLENLQARDDITAFEWVDPKTVDAEEIPAPSIRYFIKEVALREMSAGI
jgi:NAD+ diphosphatase